MYVITGFDTTGSAQSMAATVAGSPATIPAGTYCFRDLAAAMGTGKYTAFGTAVKDAFNAATASAFTVTWSPTTQLWTISRAAIFTLTFSSDAELRLRAALGFTGNKAGANSYTSDVRPHYVIVPQIDGRSKDTDYYEPADIAEEATSDGGSAFVVARQTDALYRDWQHAMEVYASTFTRQAAASAPWTWQDFFKHCRGQHPFLVSDEDHVYRLRAEGAGFDLKTRAPVTNDERSLWYVNLMTRYCGEI